MSLFRITQEIIYVKSQSETISELERAFAKIGEVKKIEPENGRISGKTKDRT